MCFTPRTHFYPRSPCGERLPVLLSFSYSMEDFYPRSPCGERHAILAPFNGMTVFLSTLSLRRATFLWLRMWKHGANFYPRSPCGERLPIMRKYCPSTKISIHALLAESDQFCAVRTFVDLVFLSTLSLRRATRGLSLLYAIVGNFYPRSPCGERPKAGLRRHAS